MPITMGMQASRHVRDPRRRIWSCLRGGGFGGCGQNWDRDRRLKNKALRSPLGLVCNAAERRRLTDRSGAPKKPRVAASHGPLPRTTARRWAAAVCARSAHLALTALALAFLAAPQDAYAQTQTEAARGQTDQDGFYVGLEMGRAHASPLTSSVTGVNHPTRCDRLLYPASTSPPASDEACRASTPTVILRNAFDLGGGAVSGLLAGYRADRVRVEVEYLTRSQGPATAAVGATTNVVLQGKDTEWSDDQPPREWIRDYAAHQIFANAYYDFPNESPWTPYVGGGLGVAITTLHYANQFIRKPEAEYLRIDFEPDWPAAAKRAAAGTLSSLDTTVRQAAFGFQVLAGADYALTEHTSVGVTGRWAQFGHITDETTWDLIRSHAPVQADGVTPFDTTQRFEGISYLAVMVGLKYHF